MWLKTDVPKCNWKLFLNHYTCASSNWMKYKVWADITLKVRLFSYTHRTVSVMHGIIEPVRSNMVRMENTKLKVVV